MNGSIKYVSFKLSENGCMNPTLDKNYYLEHHLLRYLFFQVNSVKSFFLLIYRIFFYETLKKITSKYLLILFIISFIIMK